MPFIFTRLEIPDLVLIEPKVFTDSRGFFLETFKKSDFKTFGITYEFVQDNCSFSERNVIRALHYQLPPNAQGKLVSVLKGKVWDVAVDIRKNSPFFLKWIGMELSEENHRMFYVPPGFAHGFAVLSEEAYLIYKCTSEYSPGFERGIRWNDPEIGIQWPVAEPLISDRDRNLSLLKETEIFE
jgi:dTDP-4-dehydrorhamnose 3,5-epimerase